MWPEPGERGIVLVVDDNPDTLRLLIDALEAAGLTALVARDAAAATALLDRVGPDAILLDAVMPGVDGFELCRRIKARPEHSARPVLFMTGLSETEHVVQGLRAGGVDYLVKPINPEELVARLSVHVATARMIADAQSALDATDAAVLAFRRDGTLSWASRRALRMLGDQARPLEDLPEARRRALRDWIASSADSSVSGSKTLSLETADGRIVTVSLIGRTGGGDLLTHVTVGPEGEPAERLSQLYSLSKREAEVLSWIARGKSNRDIATIMQLSPRTVTKHVEQIFLKLEVENRTSAAILAIRALNG